ncbi:MAG: hypothetical protein ACK5KP_05255 [Paludibacteraceae bacterium]
MKQLLSKYMLIFTTLMCFCTFANAQADNDIVLKAMKSEIDRSLVGFEKDSLAKPFFISLLVNETDLEYTYTTLFGKANKESTNTRISRDASPLILVGSYHRMQNIGGRSNRFPIPVSDDERAIRSAIWLNLDNEYKNAAKNYVDKMAWLHQEKLTNEELALNDFEKRNATILIEEAKEQKMNFEPIKKASLQIGQLLTQKVRREKLIVESLSTMFSFSSEVIRYYDTEGSMYKYPSGSGTFNLKLSGVNAEGENVSAYRNFRMNDLSKFPTAIELEKAVDDVVKEYRLKFTTEKSNDPYMGPVLIVDGQVEEVVRQIVNSLFTSPKTRYSNGNHYQNLPNVRILSKQLSLSIDYGKDAQGKPGVKRDFAPIDLQAVIPPDSIILIENGILKNMLTSRQPVQKHRYSNGNAKKGNRVDGVITFTGNERYSIEQIKKMLIDEAKLQGLEYAYIISNDDRLHRKLNVETGEETPFAASINLGQIMKTMRRVMGVEDQLAASSDGTVRYPKSVLLEDAEITVHKSNARLKKDVVPRPKIEH